MTKPEAKIFDGTNTISDVGAAFLFDGSEEAESYLKSLNVEYIKRNMAWQVDLTTQYI